MFQIQAKRLVKLSGNTRNFEAKADACDGLYSSTETIRLIRDGYIRLRVIR